jgi:glutathione synthase/RimK-type ligase-like ATP-grasp enzyme
MNMPITEQQALSDRLNQRCLCTTLDRKLLADTVGRAVDDPAFNVEQLESKPNLLSNVLVFLSMDDIAQMRGIVEAIEATARLPAYRNAVLAWAPESAQMDFGPLGVFMGYDFHLDDSGPKLIEVNTNAGGAFINALLAKAQKACCSEIERGLIAMQAEDFDTQARDVFTAEWRRQRGAGQLRRVAIVDDQPQEQYLYPEFILARQLLRAHGIDAVIGDASALEYKAGKLLLDGQEIDLVYNRLVDFSLAHSSHAALAAAYNAGAVVVTPNPHNHAIYAAKRNLTLLSDQTWLKAAGLSDALRTKLGGIPKTTLVTPENLDAMWAERKNLFFKPLSGHGGKAVYRGDKVTKGVWAEIAGGGYVAQAFAAPGQRIIKLDGAPVQRKMDIRLYTYAGQVLLTAARLYQGQTTNFRTAGGGFAPVFII